MRDPEFLSTFKTRTPINDCFSGLIETAPGLNWSFAARSSPSYTGSKGIPQSGAIPGLSER